jgi:tetratricopeptide (TPR) repeat protein
MALGLGTLGTALAAEPRATPPDPTELNNSGVKLAGQARYADAEAAFRQALDSWAGRGETPETARSRALALENLGTLLQIAGRYTESEVLLTQSLSQLQATTGESSPDVGGVLEKLAALYRAKGDPYKAESCALRAGAMLSEPRRTGNRVTLASIYVEEHRYAEARTILEPILPVATGDLAFTVNAVLGAAALNEGKLEDAAGLFRHALDIAATALPPEHFGLAAVWTNLGHVYRFQKRHVEAESSYRKAIEIWTATRGPSHPLVGYGLRNFAAFEHYRGREHAAEVLYQRAAAIFEQAFGTDDLQTLIARNELGEVFRAQGRYVASEQLSRATLPAIQKLLPESDPRVLGALANFARLLASTSRGAEATALWKHIHLVTQAMISEPTR